MTALRLDPAAFNTIMNLMLKRNWLTEKSEALVELYNLCDRGDQQRLIIDLLDRFLLLPSSQLDEKGREIAEHVAKEWCLTSDNALIIATADGKISEIDGSQAALQSLKNKFAEFDWEERNFISTIGQGAHKIKENQTAILFDDFIGTGKTMRRKYNWFQSKLIELGKRNVQTKVISLAIMEFTYSTLVGDGVVIFSPILLKKGITEYYNPSDVSKYILEMMKLEEKLEDYYKGKERNTYSLGYCKSETIYAVEGFNVPNNVFPVFWWPEVKPRVKRKLLFQRLL